MAKRKGTDSEQGAGKRHKVLDHAVSVIRTIPSTVDNFKWLVGILYSVEDMYKVYFDENTAKMITAYGCALLIKCRLERFTKAHVYACLFLACKMLDDESPDNNMELIVCPRNKETMPPKKEVAHAELDIVYRLHWNLHLTFDQVFDLLS